MFIFNQSNISSYLDMESEDLVVTNLLSKYNINSETSFMYNVNDDYKALIEFISQLYIDEKKIPEDIVVQLNENINFKASLILNIKDKMTNILADNTTIVFKEIVTIVNLLSFGKKFEVFENYNFYNLEELSALFREFEDRLKELKDLDERDFNITFEQYTILIEVINELCTINATDVQRKKTISSLVEIISETINIVKYNVNLNEERINILNNILGKLLFYYSHIPYIDTTNKDAQYLIDEFKFNFEKICDGYNLSKSVDFAYENDDEEIHYKVFLNSVTTLICTLLYKLEITYPYNEYNKLAMFQNIITLYNEEITHSKLPVLNTIEEFRTELLKNYTYIYDKTIKNDDYLFLIDEFIENPNFNSSNMHILHSLILFSSFIDDEKLLKVIEILISLDKFKNDYHEFYKLNVCDVIINRFTYEQNQMLKEELIDKIINYIEENKIASHLMSIYSKIYLSLSLYFSYFDDYKSLDKSKLFYFNYVSINGDELLENEYSKLNKDILQNHGKKYISNLELENVMVSDLKCEQIGKNVLKKYFEQQELNLKYNINQKLSNIVTEIFTNDGLNDDLLNKHIESFISKDIFHGLTFSSVDGLCENECHLIDLGYERIDIPLIDKYTLKMAYSKVYKHIFDNIFENNKEYIKQNIINIIVSYVKSIPIYKDPITKLNNIDKLKTELNKKSDEEFIIVELYIEDLMSLNRKYNYEKVNKSFKKYTKDIATLVNPYRFTGPRIAFLMNTKDNYKEVIEKIKDIHMKCEDEIIEPNLIVAVSWGNKNNILEKSEHCLSLAFSRQEKYYEFK